MKVDIGLKLYPRDLDRRLARGGTVAADELSAAIHALGLAAQRTARRAAPVDTGLLRSSIGLETQRLRAWVGSTRRHAAPMEYGARPHWPPHEPIFNWVWRKRREFSVVTPSGRAARGAGARRQAERIAFAVRRAIARRSLKARGYLRAAMEEVARRATRLVGKVAQKIAIRLVSR